MPIVFDEIVGQVVADATPPSPQQQAEQQRPAQDARQMLRHAMSLVAQREARLRAD